MSENDKCKNCFEAPAILKLYSDPKMENFMFRAGFPSDKCASEFVSQWEADGHSVAWVKCGHNSEPETDPATVVEPVVANCFIEPPKGMGDRAKVVATFTNGETKTVASYFNDELSFSTHEFIGLTSEQCSELFTRKDKQYLQS